MALILVCLAAVASGVPRLPGLIDLRWDGGAYYILGTSLARGTGYRLLNEPGQIETVLHPPFLPALVAVHQLVLGTEDWTVVAAWLKRSFFVCFIVYIGLAYVMLRAYLPRAYAMVVAAMTLLHYSSQFLSNILFAEIPFSLITMLFFICARFERRTGYTVLAGLAAMTAYTLRTAGVALLAAWIGDAVLRREYRAAAVRLVICLAPVLAWHGYIALVQSGPSYRTPAYEYQRAPYMYSNVTYATNAFVFRNPFRPELGDASSADIAQRFLGNLSAVPAALGEAVTANRNFWDIHRASVHRVFQRIHIPEQAVWVILFGLGALVGVGGLIQLVGHQWLLPLYLGLSIALICLTPFREQFWRYLVPVIPVLGLWLVIGLHAIVGMVPGRVRTPLARLTAVGIGFLLLFQVVTLVLLYRDFLELARYPDRRSGWAEHRLLFYRPSDRALDDRLDWLGAHADADAILAAADPHWAYLRSGRRTVFPPFEPDAAKAQYLLDQVPVRYLIIRADAAVAINRFAVPVVERDPQGWQPILPAEAGVMLYERAR